MAHDPFTLDLFGASALSGGIGVTAFAGAHTNDDGEPDPTPPGPVAPIAALPSRNNAIQRRGENFRLDEDRGLAVGWKDRARDNIAAIRLAAEIEAAQRPAGEDEQRRLIRFIGFGATSRMASSATPARRRSGRAGKISAPNCRRR